jgi:hypothetical protein
VEGDPDGGNERATCPCCKQEAAGDNLRVLVETLKSWKSKNSPLLDTTQQADQDHRAEKEKFQKWRKVVFDSLGQLRDYWRISEEVSKLEKELQELDLEMTESKGSLKERKKHVDDLRAKADDLCELADATKQWTGDASRIAGKKMQISQKLVKNSYRDGGMEKQVCSLDHSNYMIGVIYKEVDDARYFEEKERYGGASCMGGCGRRLVSKGPTKEGECVVTKTKPAYGCVNETIHNCLHVVCAKCFQEGMERSGSKEKGEQRRTRRNR